MAELAVAVIIGGAFGAIVSSFVDDVITPLLLAPALNAINAADLDQLAWGTVKYGKFIAAILKFIIIAFILFLFIKVMNRTKKKEEAAPAGPPEEIVLLREIRDALKDK